MINIKNLDLNDIEINKKSYKNVLIYYLHYVTPNGIKPFYLVINNANRCIEESNGNKGANIKIFLDQHIITQMIMMKNI